MSMLLCIEVYYKPLFVVIVVVIHDNMKTKSS